MLVLFPCSPINVREIDADFATERTAARAAGFDVALIDHTRVTTGSAEAAIAAVPRAHSSAIYRGWMLTPDRYRALYDALLTRGITLVNSPAAYRTCHYLPDNVALLGSKTARSVWYPVNGPVDFDAIHELVSAFGDAPIIVKDYVKSQKHYWSEACFIPNASDRAAVERVVRRFLELQGDDLNVGLVFREFLQLKIAGTHPKSGMPLAAEVRTFWARGRCILSHRYWGDLTDLDAELPLEELEPVAARVPSNFFAMDAALRDDGEWAIVELGDGQVSGLPSETLAVSFYAALKRSFDHDGA